MLLNMIMQAAPEVPGASSGAIGTRELIVLLVMLAVMIVQLVNNVVSSRHNAAVQQKVQDLKESVVITIRDGMHDIDDSFKKLQETMTKVVTVVGNLNTTISGMNAMSDSIRRTNELVEAILKIVDLRDEEGRRRMYTPNKSDEIQKEILQLIVQMNTTQSTITANLGNVGVALHDVIMLVSGSNISTLTDTTKMAIQKKGGVK